MLYKGHMLFKTKDKYNPCLPSLGEMDVVLSYCANNFLW